MKADTLQLPNFVRLFCTFSHIPTLYRNIGGNGKWENCMLFPRETQWEKSGKNNQVPLEKP